MSSAPDMRVLRRMNSYGEEDFSNIAKPPSIDPPRSHHSDYIIENVGPPGFSPRGRPRSRPISDDSGYHGRPTSYSPPLQRPLSRPVSVADFEPSRREEVQHDQVDDLSNFEPYRREEVQQGQVVDLSKESDEEQQMDDDSEPSSETGSDSPKPSPPPIPTHITVPNKETEIENLEYRHASNVNVSNFVSVKLCGKSNYRAWMAQMECLMRSHKMLGIVNDKYDWPGNKSEKIIKQYEILLTGWLIGSLNEIVIKDNRIYEKHVKEIWKTLRQSYDPYATQTDSTLLQYGGEKTITGISNDPNPKELHDATIEGHWRKIKSILKNDKGAAKLEINDDGDTLLHLAVRKGKNNIIKELLNFIGNEEIEIKNLEGHTALHIAAIVGNKDAAELLVEKRKDLLGMGTIDNGSLIPVMSAYLSKQVDVFVYLWEAMKDKGFSLDEYVTVKNNFCDKFLHTAIFMKQYDLAKKLVNINPFLANDSSTFVELTRYFPSDIGFVESLIYPSLNNGHSKMVKRSTLLFHSLEYMYTKAEDTLWEMRKFKNNSYSWLLPEIVILLLVPVAVTYPIYQFIRLLILVLLFPCSMLYFLLWKVLASVVAPINNIQKKRKKYREARVFLKWIFDKNKICWSTSTYQDSAFDTFFRGSLMEAVRLDVSEVLSQIMDISLEAMDFKDNEGHNIIQLAVINRSKKVYNLISPIIEHKREYRRMKDNFKNNLLHLAGILAPLTVLSCTTGAALQLQRELQWRKEVEKLMEYTQLTEENVGCETPEEVFSREHANLVKDGEKWMKTTAESCSITAALIITIVFAAAITVPGGSNQETGIPLFKRRIAFNIFAVADAISLFSASTSLLVFLSILTTRFAEKDFLISLPRRLIVGLCLLFLSTTAMMLAFSTILFLVFCEERPWMLAPIGGLTCFPIAAIVTLQLPLVIDLYQATYIPIFGKHEKEEKVQKLLEAEDKKQKGKFRNILRDINPILKRRPACCLPVHRGNL